MLTQELISYFFDGQPHLLSQPMGIWLESRRFAVFATTFRDKIRKKLRVTQDQESLLDLRLELVTAYLLLQERSLNLVYEPQLAERTRSPDFAVSYTTSFTFMLEVTRLRAEVRGQDLSTSTAQTHPLTPLIDERLADTICSKLGQLLPQHSNVLLVGVEALRLTQSDLRATLLRIQQRAEQNDAIFLQKHRFRDRTHFFQHYMRLSEVLVRRAQSPAGEPVISWVNPQAKHPLPVKVRTALYRSQTV